MSPKTGRWSLARTPSSVRAVSTLNASPVLQKKKRKTQARGGQVVPCMRMGEGKGEESRAQTRRDVVKRRKGL